MATGSLQLTIADDFGVSQQFVSRCIKETLLSIARTFKRYVVFPDRLAIRATNRKFQDTANFPGVIVAIDCTHIPIENPGRERAEKFRCRKGFFSLNVQGVCGPNLEFHNIVCRWPGSVHGSRIFTNSDMCMKLEQSQNTGHMLGDSAYPLRAYPMTPISNPNTDSKVRYYAAHAKTRNVIERTFGVWKRRFRVLSSQLRTKLNTSMLAICSAVVLQEKSSHYVVVKWHEDMYLYIDVQRQYSFKGYGNICVIS
nr:putative nuclease HARBI1 [Penaeus vannamei]